VQSGHGSRFPAVPFNATIYNSTDYTNAAEAFHAGQAEIVRVTAITTDTFTITRAQEGTTAVNLNTGGKTYTIFAGLTAKFAGDIPSGGGSGSKTYAVFTPRNNQPPPTGFATLDLRNAIDILDFDDSVEESAVFASVLPEAASVASGLIVRVTWSAASATSGSVRWGVQFMRLNTDIDSDSFDFASEVTTATASTSGVPAVTSITATAIDGISAGDAYRVRIYRDVSDASDTVTGDAELISVEIRSAA
jgi:hypothetical protein